jgi:type IV secretory pathway TrbD component
VRSTKFRQAAFVYLHVAILYEAAAYAMWRAGRLPHTTMGPPQLWLLLGGVVAGLVFLGLLRWQNVLFVRAIWLVHGLRLPTLVHGAFFPSVGALPPAFYLTAMVVVMINLWMLARAAWDL